MFKPFESEFCQLKSNVSCRPWLYFISVAISEFTEQFSVFRLLARNCLAGLKLKKKKKSIIKLLVYSLKDNLYMGRETSKNQGSQAPFSLI